MNEIKQQITDDPKDTKIKIVTHDGIKLCYAPYLENDERNFIYLDDCNAADVIPARYDVFQRIAFNVNDKWLCLTAPESITGSQGSTPGPTDWDYVSLKPCALNDRDQKWIIKDNAIYTAVDNFRIKDYKYYAFISKNYNDYYDHTLDDSMSEWVKTIAHPPTLTIKTSIAWNYVTRTWGGLYYLNSTNYSKYWYKVDLYYNPENNRIYDFKNNDYYCMVSNQTKDQDWNWMSWQTCDDKIPKNKDNMSWDFFTWFNQTYIVDWNNNFLSVNKTGTNWGYPYTTTEDYLDKNNQEPTYFFLDSYEIENWNRYYYGNVGRNLDYCPVDNNSAIAPKSKKREVRSLPRSFRLTEAWIRRLYQIATTSQGAETPIALCGTCLLHSLQIVAELNRYSFSEPPTSGGYFFDTMAHGNAMGSFRARNPILAERLEFTFSIVNHQMGTRGRTGERLVRRMHPILITMLPQFSWSNNDHADGVNIDDYINVLTTLFNAPINTVWVIFIFYYDFTSPVPMTIRGHAEVLLRTQDGIALLPTNRPSMDYQTYRNIVNNVATNGTELYDNITLNRSLDLHSMMVSAVEGYDELSFNYSISNNDCSGFGPNRRGNGNRVTGTSINKCFGGSRCSIQ